MTGEGDRKPLATTPDLWGSGFYKIKIPSGSPLTTIFKVSTAAILNRSPSNAVVSMSSLSPSDTDHQQNLVGKDLEETKTPSTSFRFLNHATMEKPTYNFLRCSVKEVEDVKIVLRILPVFGCTIMLNCCLAQLSTFSVQQASTMNTKIGSVKVSAASLPVFPVMFIIFLAPIYDHIIIPFARKARKSEMGVTHLQRIGVGLLLSIMARCCFFFFVHLSSTEPEVAIVFSSSFFRQAWVSFFRRALVSFFPATKGCVLK